MHKEENMTDKEQMQAATDPRPEYEPPRALRLSDMHTGTGGIMGCIPTGSSDSEGCLNGLLAGVCDNGQDPF